MKYLKALLLILLLSFSYIYYSDQSGENNELAELKLELEAKENILQRMEIDIEKIIANAPVCEKGPAEVTIDRTSMYKLQEEVEELKKRIADMEQ